MRDVIVIETGVANIASMLAAISRLEHQALLTSDRETIAAATHLVLPGVGAFGAGMERLRELDLVDLLRERFEDDAKATFCVCLGLQLLCQTSEESEGVKGLGILDAEVTRFPSSVRAPQLGWNEVSPINPQENTFLTTPGHAYYANSYRLSQIPEGWRGATSDHGGEFVAAIERGRDLACQFHPELSSAWGHDLMRRWIEFEPGEQE